LSSGYGFSEIFRVPGVDERNGDAVSRKRGGKEVRRSAVEGGRGDDLVARARDIQDGAAYGGVSRGEGHRRNAAFQCRHAFFQHFRGGVADAGVDISLLFESKKACRMSGTFESIRRGLINRHRAGECRRIGFVSGVDGQGIETECFRKTVVSGHFFASSVLLNRLFPVAISLYPEWRKNTTIRQIRRTPSSW
jgi:hypothetical protein